MQLALSQKNLRNSSTSFTSWHYDETWAFFSQKLLVTLWEWVEKEREKNKFRIDPGLLIRVEMKRASLKKEVGQMLKIIYPNLKAIHHIS